MNETEFRYHFGLNGSVDRTWYERSGTRRHVTITNLVSEN